MRRTFSIAVIALTCTLLLLTGCRNKDMFTLDGTVGSGSDDSILVVGLDNRFDRVDTIRPDGGKFEWSFRPDTATTLILLLPDGSEYPVFAERGIEARIFIPDAADGGIPSVTGSIENESFHDFALKAADDDCFEQTAARIDSFIGNDPFSEVTPYIIYAYALKKWHAESQDVMNLVEKMSGIMQDTPFLTYLKPELKSDEPEINRYLNSMDVYDTAGVKYDFANVGDRNNFMLVCLWATWNGEAGIDARNDMDTLVDLFIGRHLDLADVSVDVNTKRWKQTIQHDTLKWYSYNDPSGWNSRLLNITSDFDLPVYIFLTETKRFSFKSQDISDVIFQLEQKLPVRNGDMRKIRW
ncbi:MAG: DUF4369 domain-containing protein [Bacteroidaceae bacterium]|nr:DUF4369 domain-containing protein [Bacteroidaceae bacterium]